MRSRRWLWVAALWVMMSWTAVLAQGTDEAIAKLKDLDPSERQMAVATLGYATPSAKILKALLETASSDPDSTVVAGAIEAIGTLAQSADEKNAYVGVLLDLLASEDPAVGLCAASALEPLGEKGSEARRLALYQAGLEDEELRSQALLGLTRHTGPQSMEILLQLISVSPAPEDALMALYMKPGSKGESLCADRLAKGLEGAPGEDFDTCFSMALRISDRKDVLVPVLTRLTETLPDLGQRFDAALTLYRWTPGKRTLEPVAKLLEEPESMTGGNLGKVMAEIHGTDIKHLRAPLLKALPTVEDESVLSTIIDALAVPGPGEEEALAGMLAHKNNSSALVRARVAKSVATLGSSSGKAVPALKELMKDPELEVAVIAANSYYKLTADKAPVVAVFQRAAKSEVGAEMLYTNIDVDVAWSLSQELFDILVPMVKAGDATARQVLPPLLEHIDSARLSEVLAIYPELDPDSRTMFLSSLSSVHIARAGVRDFLVKLTASKEPYEAYQAAQLLFEKAGDPQPLLAMARRDLRSGKSDQILQAVNYVTFEPQLAGELLSDLQACLGSLDDDDAKASVLLGIMQTEGRPQALSFLLESMREGSFDLISRFFYDTDTAADLAPRLSQSDLQKLVDYLKVYSKNARSWDSEMPKAAFCCLILKEAEAADLGRDVLQELAAHHPNDTIRSYALEALGEKI